MKGFDVKSTYDMDTEDGSLLWTITLKNKSDAYLEFGDVGLPMPWNNKYTNQNSVYSERVTCEKHLTSGRLVMLNEFGTLISGTYFLVMQTNIKPGIQEFSEWLGKNIAAAREQP